MARQTITNKQNDEFLRALDSAVNEKDVENAYRRVLSNYYDDGYTQISSPHKCDGYYSNYMFLRLLIEVKYEEDFLRHTIRCKTITQAIWYIKQFELSGEKLPNVVLIGDRNECFIVYGSHLYKYLKEDVDWTIAPSEAAATNNDFVMKLVSDKAICPFVFKINQKDFRMRDVCQAIDQLSQRGALTQVKLNAHNIRRIYDDFLRTVIRDYIKNYTTNELVSIFILAMVDPVNCYIHPAKKIRWLFQTNLEKFRLTVLHFTPFSLSLIETIHQKNVIYLLRWQMY